MTEKEAFIAGYITGISKGLQTTTDQTDAEWVEEANKAFLNLLDKLGRKQNDS